MRFSYYCTLFVNVVWIVGIYSHSSWWLLVVPCP